MNILVVEDSYKKLADIINNLNEQYKDAKIVYFSSLMESIFFIKNNHDYIDFIVLDWNFPMYNGEHPSISMGNDLLTYLKKHEYNIDVIVCSSEYVETSFDNVKKMVLYDTNTKLDFTYNKVRKK